MKKVWVFLFLVIFISGCVPDKFSFKSEFGKAGSGPGEFNAPIDMELTPDEDLVISDSGNNRFQVISQDGTFKFSGGEFGTKPLQISSITGIGVHGISGDILVCDLKGNKLVRYDKNGNPKMKIVQKVKGPLDGAFDKLGNIYVVMARQSVISKYDQLGNFIGTIGGGEGALVYPISIRIVDDFIYVADSGARRIVKMNINGEFVAAYNAKGDFEPMKGPSSVFADNVGYIYVLDAGEIPVVFLNPEGKLLSKIGGFGDKPGFFMYPRSVVALNNGDVFILDSNRNMVIRYKKS